MTTRTLATAVVILAMLISLPRAEQRSVFRSGTELVRVNVVVRDKSGAVVRNLSRDDFSVTEDDKPQTITSFDFEQLDPPSQGGERAPATAGQAPEILSPTAKADSRTVNVDDRSAKALAERSVPMKVDMRGR